ncbi:MAG: zinc ribbon domain-containing protein [Thermoplasmataceae archaeon]
MTDFQSGENEIMREKAVMVKNSQRISNGYLLLTNMRLLYQSNNGKEDVYPDRGIFLWQVGEVHGSRPRLGVRSGRILTVEFKYDGSQDSVEFIVDNPEKWSKAIKEWATHAYDRNVGIDRTIDDDLIRNREEKSRSDITLSHGFFESITGFRKFGSGDKEHSMNEKRCNNCGSSVKEGSNFCTSCGCRLI